jgi:ABC-type multidrug transport system fused ATPase/permease subunit
MQSWIVVLLSMRLPHHPEQFRWRYHLIATRFNRALSDKFGLSLQSMSTVLIAFIVAFTIQWKLTDVTATIIPATFIGVGSTAAIDSKLEDALNATNADGATAAGEILGSISDGRCSLCNRQTSFEV